MLGKEKCESQEDFSAWSSLECMVSGEVPGNYRQIIQPLLANKIKTNPFTGQILALVLWFSQESECSGMRPTVAYFLSCPSGAFYKGPALPLRILNLGAGGKEPALPVLA